MFSKSKEQKAGSWAFFCCLAFLGSSLPVAPSFGQNSSEDTIRAEIGLRLPDASRFDPRTFPFEIQTPPGLTLNGSEGSWLRWQPVSLQRKAVVDSTGRFITIREDLLGEPLRFPFSVPLATYYAMRVNYEQNMLWHQMVSQGAARGFNEQRLGAGGLDIDIPVPIKSKAFSQIFGGSSVGLNVQGDIRIEGGFRREDRSEALTVVNQGANTNFKMNQTQRFTVTGRIGEKVTVNVDQDSERPFDFENSIKLNYNGFDDDILKKIEAGNISLSLPGTRFVTFGGTSAGLFGVKSEMQLGNIFITGIASQEKGENKKLTLSGGATEGSQKIEDYQYRRFAYFFIDTYYRQNFRTYAGKWIHSYDPSRAISKIEVYRSTNESDPERIQGTAYRLPPGQVPVPDSTEYFDGFFKRLRLDVDYVLTPALGYIRMETPINENDVLAVAYQDSSGNIVGDIDYVPDPNLSSEKKIRLKMIKDRVVQPNRDPNDSWHLEWKNVYYLGSRNIPQEGFELKIFQRPIGAGNAQETLIQEGKPPRSFLYVFALDEQNTGGAPTPDNIVDNDPAIIDFARGELIFPDPRPFDPDGGPFGSPIQVGETIELNRLPENLHVSAFYDTNSTSEINLRSRFYLTVKSKNKSTNYSLGFNVIEGSEEVLLKGVRLERDKDYIIDYFSGSLTLLSEEASKPDALVEVSYQSNQLFQLEKKTIMGTRAEYRMGRDSFIGGTFLYQNERSLEQRVRLGGGGDRGPLKNLIWDLNTKLEFRPNFLSHALNALPFISTQEGSLLRLEGEVAQILPNPNTLNSETTGDANGVAYIDDFEGTKRTTPLGVNRRGWVLSSIPVEIVNDAGGITRPSDGQFRFNHRRALARRGDLLWYNILVPLTVIYPNRDVNAQVAQTATVMNLRFTPHDTYTSTADSTTTTFNSLNSWAGLMRGLSPGYFDQTEAKFLELWVFGERGKIHVDLGQITEDIIPDGKPNSEDEVPRNQLLDDDEDQGLDNDNRPDPQDFWRVINNDENRLTPVWGEIPSMDDYYFPSGSAQFITPGLGSINGTQNNKNDEGGARPDTEDLNANGGLDYNNSESYFSYAFHLDPARRKYVEGGSDSTGWFLYRIPLIDTVGATGTPSFANIEYVRIWIDSVDVAQGSSTIQIAEINLVSNEWKELGLSPQDSTLTTFKKNDKRFKISVVNTEENPFPPADFCNPDENSYVSPPGVERERDRINQVLAKEQSQVLDLDSLASNEAAAAQKTFYQPLSLIHYNRLRMFVYGADKGSGLIGPDSSEIEFFLRFGADDKNFYEFRERVYCGWDQRNEMDIDLALLTNFKRLRGDYEQVVENGAPVSDYYRLPIAGTSQEWRVRGNPSLTNVRTLVAGVRNRSQTRLFYGEIWTDELRVSEVQKEKGIAARARADLKLADFANFNAEIEQLDADFHNVSTRFGTGDNTRRMTLGASITMDKLLPQWLGLSAPVSASYSESQATPKYFPGSDIIVLTSELDSLTRSHIESYSNQMGFNLSLRRRVKSNNFLIKNTIDNLSTSFSYTYAEARNSTTYISKRMGYAGNVDYSLAFGTNNFIKPFGWMGNAPFLRLLSSTKLYYTPQRVDARMQAASTDTRSQTRTLTASADSSILGPLVRPPTDYNVQHSYGTSLKILENLTADISRGYSSKVQPDTVGAKADRIYFVEGLQRFVAGQADLLSSTQSFNTRYNPTLVSWMTNSVTYTSAFRYNNNIQQVDVGRSAGVSSTFGVNASIRLSQFFQSLQSKRKAAASPASTRRPPGRTAPGQRPQEEGEAGKEGEEKPEGKEEETPPRTPPGEQPDEKPPEDPEKDTPKAGDKDKDKDKTQKEETRRGPGLNPVSFFINTFAKLKDIQLSYNQRDNLNHNALASGDISWAYQFGFADEPNAFGTAGNYTGTFRSTSNSKTYSASTGLDLTRNLALNLKFDYDVQESFNTNRTGTTSLSYFQFGEKGAGIPFPELTITWNGLEKFPLFKRFASSVNASTNVSGKKSTAWKDSTAGLIGEDFSLNFRPLVRVNCNWKNGMVTTVSYNKTAGYKPTYNPTGRPDENGFIDTFQSAAFTRSNDFSFTHTYSKRSGFRIPLPFLKNKELKNSVDLSVNYTRSLTESSAQYSRDSQEVVNNSTQRWEFSPRVTYTFSTRVRGGAHFTYGKTESRLIGKTTIKEFGLDVNISIRGQ